MRDRILKKLNEISVAENIKILFACESGSRGWKFPSIDSDYDVRFIFVRKPDAYSTIFPAVMDLQFPIHEDLDMYGWDLRKVLTLLYSSNATPFEWIQSPIVYCQELTFKKFFLQLIESYFDERKQVHHYLGTVRSKIDILEYKKVKLKSLFYVLRSLLAAEWSLNNNSYPPMIFDELMVLMPKDICNEAIDLVALKSNVNEQFEYTLTSSLRQYISDKFRSLEAKAKLTESKQFDKDHLEEFFKSILHQS
ncbi:MULTISPECIES: DNA polymerase beta superfamily protein [Sphingobacterium]|uniref:nucleotidyltransferase domain-containing protein n=1 Tax=Sphingobacterium TaxID=28453 RepID=UPI0019180F9C|nr:MULTISPECIES: nucleotidyltransferase domain-containing protein [Sphingobacterium]QQT25740.1 nucleotidyltransferase domain-containing protein [Sphingobacterium spiritivorum]